MNEKKLTDEEIVKALDVCYNSPCCTADCPYFNKNGRNLCIENKAFYRDMKRIVQEHAEQKAEIERLTEENKNLLIKVWNYERPARTPLYSSESMVNCNLVTCYNENADLKSKNAELQKQVDELETTNGQAMAYIEGIEYELKQAVKDAAKEIFEKIFEVLCCFTTQGKSKEYAEGYIDCLEEVDKRLQNLAEEKYGVEVE